MNTRFVSCNVRGSRWYTHLDVSASTLCAPYLQLGTDGPSPRVHTWKTPMPFSACGHPRVTRNCSPVIMAAHLEKSSPVNDSYIDAGSFGMIHGIHDCFPADPVELFQNHRP